MNSLEQTPDSLGFRMPAEWEPQEAIWLSWPHNEQTWPGAFEPIPTVFVNITKEIAEGQLVRINVADNDKAASVRELLRRSQVNLDNIRFHLNETNDCWARDHGPIYLVRDFEDGQRERAITNWEYNAWGGKYPPFDADNQIPQRISSEFDEFAFDGNMVLEGGSIDVNGIGALLTTTSCLLNKNRNPELTQPEIETRLRKFLGVSKILWLEEGILGDDTDGHIDDISRFVSPTTVVTAIEENPKDENFLPLMNNLELLQEMSDQLGNPLEIISLPMPAPVYHLKERLPASYANFLICNEKVLVPTYRCAQDVKAVGVLQDFYTNRTVVGIDCTDLVWGLGAIHCVSQQQPFTDRIYSA
ncbi:agmatine deiminase family protein [Planctomicrobium sp.]|jgi:agmatine deiminase|nr:agmatine deiminase family protein [Planctomicrobium sp.]MBT5018783.1 agmatine deiminase family protein [Planctomicrobium sp.]MDB4743122.1 agmatine deiminase family protein [Planctomicrobium sp.]